MLNMDQAELTLEGSAERLFERRNAIHPYLEMLGDPLLGPTLASVVQGKRHRDPHDKIKKITLFLGPQPIADMGTEHLIFEELDLKRERLRPFV